MSQVERLLETIRCAALDADAWTDLQEKAQEYIGCFASQLAVVDHRNGNSFWSRTTTVPHVDDLIRAHMIDSEPVRYASRTPNWRTFVDYDYIDERAIQRSSFYNECRRFEVDYRLALRLIDSPGVSKAIVFIHRKQEGHFQSSEIEKLKLIQDQLRLAAHVAESLGGSLNGGHHVVDSLEKANTAALIAEPDGRVVHANPLARCILEAEDGLMQSNGILIVAERSAQQGVNARLASAARALRGDQLTGGGFVVVPRIDREHPLILVISPLPAARQFLGPARRLSLVLIHDPERRARLQEQPLRSAFGLTEAEAQVSTAFAAGKSLEQIADRRSVSLGTVRQQIKTIMSKTNTERQADLIRVLLNLPAKY